MRKKHIILLSVIILFVLAVGLLGYRGFCPPWKKYVNYNRDDLPPACYTPAPDKGTVCFQSLDCISKHCMGKEDDPIIIGCNLKLNQENYCPGVSGFCGDGREKGGIRITKKDYASLTLVD